MVFFFTQSIEYLFKAGNTDIVCINIEALLSACLI